MRTLVVCAVLVCTTVLAGAANATLIYSTPEPEWGGWGFDSRQWVSSPVILSGPLPYVVTDADVFMYPLCLGGYHPDVYLRLLEDSGGPDPYNSPGDVIAELSWRSWPGSAYPTWYGFGFLAHAVTLDPDTAYWFQVYSDSMYPDDYWAVPPYYETGACTFVGGWDRWSDQGMGVRLYGEQAPGAPAFALLAVTPLAAGLVRRLGRR